MRTTLNISDGILQELRELARQRKRPFRQVLEETLQRGMTSGQNTGRRIRLITRRVGMKPAYLVESMNHLYDQIEAEDTTRRGKR